MGIIGALALVTIFNLQSSQIKARDVERKSDLHNIADALEAYMNDHGSYPAANSGRIVSCECTSQVCAWGTPPREFCDTASTVYMKEIPDEAVANPPTQPHYCYSSDGSSFKLYARLESSRDQEKMSSDKSCGEVNNYNFIVSSKNTAP